MRLPATQPKTPQAPKNNAIANLFCNFINYGKLAVRGEPPYIALNTGLPE
jgi:hypothetical protein